LAHQGSDVYPSQMESTKAPSTEMFKMVQIGLGTSSAGVRIHVRARQCAAKKGEVPTQEMEATAIDSESSSNGASAIDSGSGVSAKSVLDRVPQCCPGP
jgi:hypothetical protein